jgi:hypothetical protein
MKKIECSDVCVGTGYEFCYVLLVTVASLVSFK